MVSLPPLDPNASPPAASRAYAGGRAPPAASHAYAGGLASRRAAARARPPRAVPCRWPRLPPRSCPHAGGRARPPRAAPTPVAAPPAASRRARSWLRPARCPRSTRHAAARTPEAAPRPPRAHAHPVGCSPPTARAAAPVAARTPWGSRIEMAVGICTGGDISTNYYTPKILTEGKPHENSCRRNTICMRWLENWQKKATFSKAS